MDGPGRWRDPRSPAPCAWRPPEGRSPGPRRGLNPWGRRPRTGVAGRSSRLPRSPGTRGLGVTSAGRGGTVGSWGHLCPGPEPGTLGHLVPQRMRPTRALSAWSHRPREYEYMQVCTEVSKHGSGSRCCVPAVNPTALGPSAGQGDPSSSPQAAKGRPLAAPAPTPGGRAGATRASPRLRNHQHIPLPLVQINPQKICPALWEAKVGGLLDPRSSRLQ
ncbi:uncharacterized protein LOC123636018 [Lemur catta]|uniref:uncharacterized protein LOC123636018 n=1 Tax=Lemur catta TaxID=9447 RepID=UPI001E26D4F3|nr:uncharacterized protein LOC123636018 [Lemur catta]